MDNGRTRPGQERRDDQSDALSRSCRRKAEDVLRSVVAKIVVTETAEDDTVRMEEHGSTNLGLGRQRAEP